MLTAVPTVCGCKITMSSTFTLNSSRANTVIVSGLPQDPGMFGRQRKAIVLQPRSRVFRAEFEIRTAGMIGDKTSSDTTGTTT
jgi:hypothetical protein